MKLILMTANAAGALIQHDDGNLYEYWWSPAIVEYTRASDPDALIAECESKGWTRHDLEFADFPALESWRSTYLKEIA